MLSNKGRIKCLVQVCTLGYNDFNILMFKISWFVTKFNFKSRLAIACALGFKDYKQLYSSTTQCGYKKRRLLLCFFQLLWNQHNTVLFDPPLLIMSHERFYKLWSQTRLLKQIKKCKRSFTRMVKIIEPYYTYICSSEQFICLIINKITDFSVTGYRLDEYSI